MNRVYLALGVPGEVQAVGLAGYWQYEGESIMIHHIVPHIVKLSIQTCKHKKKLISTDYTWGRRPKMRQTFFKTFISFSIQNTFYDIPSFRVHMNSAFHYTPKNK